MAGKAVGVIGVIIALTIGAWYLSLALQIRLIDRCNVQCFTFSDYERVDPLCIIDPTCVSPLYNPHTLSPQPWTGLAYWGFGWGEPKHPSIATALAIPNYVLFTLLAALTAAATSRWVKRTDLRHGILLAIFVWCILSATSWFIPAMNPGWSRASYNPGTQPLWLALTVPGMTLLVVASAAVIGRIASH